jgi:hypothetical protein
MLLLGQGEGRGEEGRDCCPDCTASRTPKHPCALLAHTSVLHNAAVAATDLLSALMYNYLCVLPFCSDTFKALQISSQKGTVCVT